VVAANPVKLEAARHGAQRRRELHQRTTGMDEFPEVICPAPVLEPSPTGANPDSFAARCFTEGELSEIPNPEREIPISRLELTNGVALELVRIDPGEFIMGADRGYPNEHPARAQVIDEPFLMGRFEVSNRQYRCFDPDHDSGLETGEAYQFGDDERGFPLRRPEQPVVRVSWNQAMAFCDWLSIVTGRQFTLPTEAQWEFACRAGTTTPFSYGSMDSDFSAFANFSDATHHTVYYHHVPDALPPWRPADTRFDDQWRVAAPVGTFQPNPWGLHDLHGNVAEWTRSDYRAYTDRPDSSTVRSGPGTRKVVRGGSWLDVPRRGRSAFRLHYEPSQAMVDVGFRVICEP
jgi:formylglycine-generating enzyme required for sulfatase activity